MGVTAWETVAEPPQGDNNLGRAKANVGDRLTLIGNLDQVYFLKTASQSEIERKVKGILSVGKPGGRFIFSGSDYLEKGTPMENIETAVQAAKIYGSYST
jgi:uroporphyrinogen-III decarboxylase